MIPPTCYPSTGAGRSLRTWPDQLRVSHLRYFIVGVVRMRFHLRVGKVD